MKISLVFTFVASALMTFRAAAGDLPIVGTVDWQPLSAQVNRLIEAMDYLGAPLASEDKTTLKTVLEGNGNRGAVQKVQKILDHYCLFGVQINPEMRVKVAQGPAKPELVEQGWRVFLVKVQNDSGSSSELRAVSPNAMSVFQSGSSKTASDAVLGKQAKLNTNALWLDLQMFNAQPLKKDLSGFGLEYRVVQLYSRD